MKEISSLQHPLVKHLVKLKKERSYRYETKTAVIEGRKMISEIPAKTILTTNPKEPLQADEVILVTEAVLEKISGMRSPEGILAEVAMPSHELKHPRRLLALDCINDPGNLGVLLRTALAFGWDGAFLLDGCADPYNDKALSAARGATFKLPFLQGSWKALLPLAEANGLTRLVADMWGDAPSKKEKVLLVLGNEANGPSKETLAHCETVHIPISNQMESLNVAVAGGILMYSL